MIVDVIISHGADLATTTRVALEHARRSGQPTGVRWGETRWDVWPSDSIELGIQRFHRAAAERRIQRQTQEDDTDE